MSKITESKLKKNMPTLIILIISGALIYALPYFRNYYYDAFVESFGITNTQMGALGSAYGGFSIIAYALGGFCADRWPAKHLMTISLVTTGICGFVLLLFPPYPVVMAIHCIWGITSILTFWSALVKAIRSLANSDEQGKAFGFFEGGRGISNAAYLAVAVAMFGYFTAKSGEKMGVRSIVIFYSAATVLLGICSIFLLKGIEEEKGSTGDSFNIRKVGTVLKMPATWLLIGIIFCTYTANISYYYIAPYATAAFGTTAVIAAIISSSSQYIRPFAAIGAGVLGDKINSSKVMLAGTLMTVLGLGVVLVTPENSSVILILIGCVLIYASMYITQSMHFALMEESEFPSEITGTAVGIICCLGYLPEAVCPFFAGRMLDNFKGTEGYKMIFVAWMAVTIIGVLLTIIWLKVTKEKRKKLLKKK